MSNPFIGEIRPFAGNYAPRNWHFCDGSLLEIAEYELLHTLLGTSYGGDGRATFGVPDLRSRIPIGRGRGTGLTNRPLAETGGTESVTLTAQQVAAHSHGVIVSADAGRSPQPGQHVPGAPANEALFYLAPGAGIQIDAVLAADSIVPTGGRQAHENRMPITALNFIIALTGIYPSRN